MLAILATMTLLALGFPAKARLMPLTAGVPGSLLALAALVQESRQARREAAPDTRARRAERRMLAWLAVYFLGILACGFLYAAPVLVAAFLWLGQRERLAAAAIGAAGTWAVLYGVFERAFEIPLFDGLVIAWLAG